MHAHEATSTAHKLIHDIRSYAKYITLVGFSSNYPVNRKENKSTIQVIIIEDCIKCGQLQELRLRKILKLPARTYYLRSKQFGRLREDSGGSPEQRPFIALREVDVRHQIER